MYQNQYAIWEEEIKKNTTQAYFVKLRKKIVITSVYDLIWQCMPFLIQMVYKQHQKKTFYFDHNSIENTNSKVPNLG